MLERFSTIIFKGDNFTFVTVERTRHEGNSSCKEETGEKKKNNLQAQGCKNI